MVGESENTSFFVGIYDVPETARYLKAATYGDLVYAVDSGKLIRWIRRGVASPNLVGLHGTELLIAFEDLISIRVVAALRAAGVTWAEIDRTEHWLRTKLRFQRPFATEYLWTGQGEVYIDWTQRLLSASRNGQLALGLLKDYLIPIHGLMFSAETHLATSWEPINGIVLEPDVQFGTPCIKGTRIPTRTIAGMVAAGDSVDWVVEAYDLTIEEVNAACEWESRLRTN